MIQAQGLSRRPGGMIPLLLIFSILCMLAGGLACGTVCQTVPRRFPCAVCGEEGIRLLTDKPEEISRPGDLAAAVGVQNAVFNDTASAFGKGTSFRACRTVVFLAGFFFVGGYSGLFTRKCLLARLYEEKPERARFLRELSIQKKKDGKKRVFPTAAEGWARIPSRRLEMRACAGRASCPRE